MSYKGVAGYGVTSSGGVAMPALQSEIVPAAGMYALDMNTASGFAVSGADRSGNGNNLIDVNPYSSMPDIIVGSKAPYLYQAEVPSNTIVGTMALPAGTNAAAYQAGMNILGEMSITLRVAKTLCPPLGGAYQYYEYIVAFGDFLNGGAPGNVSYALLINRDPPLGTLTYYAQNGVHAGIPFQSTLYLGPGGADVAGVHTDGNWHFVSMRRTAAGVVTLGVDGNYQTSGALALPSDGSAGRFNIGKAPRALNVFPDIGFIGLIKDVCVWQSFLTDNQVQQLELQAMGPYYRLP